MAIGFPGGSDVKASACKVGDPGSIPTSGDSLEIPSLVLLLGKPHGPRSLVGYSQGLAKSRTRLSNFTYMALSI